MKEQLLVCGCSFLLYSLEKRTQKAMNQKLKIRAAQPADAPRLAEIYAPYVRETVVTFEETAPDAAEMARRVREVERTFPWLVCESGGQVLGYAYAHQLQERAAFQWSAEVSIYLARNERGHGAGSALYHALEARLYQMGVAQLYAQISVPNPESMGFHHRCGYQDLCVYPHVGYKLGRWCDLAVLTKQLQLPEHPQPRKNP